MLLLMTTMGATVMLAQSQAAAKTKPMTSASERDWNKLVDDFLMQLYYKFHPAGATGDGLHQFDSQLQDLSKESVEAEAAMAKQFLQRIDGIDAAKLDAESQIDRRMLQGW